MQKRDKWEASYLDSIYLEEKKDLRSKNIEENVEF
jgi:hypothetical protein